MLKKEKRHITMNVRLLMTISVILAVLGWAVLPLPRTQKAPAVYLPVHTQTLYAHKGGKIIEVRKQRGDTVAPGDILMMLESRRLDNDIDCLAVTIQQLGYTRERLGGNADRLGMLPEIETQLASCEEEMAGLMAQKQQLVVRASIAGTIADMDQLLQPGSYVMENQVLGVIVPFDRTRIDAFVSEKEIGYIRTGQEVIFYPRDLSRPIVGRVVRVNPIREEVVDPIEIGAAAAGELPLVKKESSDRMTLLESYYKVHIDIASEPSRQLRLGTSGHVRYQTAEHSLALNFLQYAYSVIIRESGF